MTIHTILPYFWSRRSHRPAAATLPLTPDPATLSPTSQLAQSDLPVRQRLYHHCRAQPLQTQDWRGLLKPGRRSTNIDHTRALNFADYAFPVRAS
jgi:hypothetical protein